MMNWVKAGLYPPIFGLSFAIPAGLDHGLAWGLVTELAIVLAIALVALAFALAELRDARRGIFWRDRDLSDPHWRHDKAASGT